MNRVIMSGRLVADWETKGGQTKVGKNRLAVDKLKDDAFFVNITAFGKTAEIAEEYTKKGNKIFIEGRLEINKYEDKYFTEVIVDRLEFMNNSNKDEPKAKQHTEPSRNNNSSNEPDDEFPF